MMDFSLTEDAVKEEPPKPEVEAVPLLLPPETPNTKSETPNIVEGTPNIVEEEKAELVIVPESEQLEPQDKKDFEKRKIKKVERQPLWTPKLEEYQVIKDMAELGWPAPQIAEALNVTPQQFAGALVRYPKLKEIYEQAVAENKGFADRKLAWRPKPEDLEQVRYHASKGLRGPEIAAKLKVSRHAFTRRMNDTPQLQAAYEQGEGEFRAGLIETSQQLIDMADPALRHMSQMMIFKLKAHCELTDRVQQDQKVVHEGNVQHSHDVKLNAPKPVKPAALEDYAKAEMEEAKKINGEQMKAIEAQIVEDDASE